MIHVSRTFAKWVWTTAVGSILAHGLAHTVPLGEQLRSLRHLLDLTKDTSMAGWMSVCVAGFLAVRCVSLAMESKRWWWSGIALLFALISLDEATRFHRWLPYLEDLVFLKSSWFEGVELGVLVALLYLLSDDGAGRSLERGEANDHLEQDSDTQPPETPSVAS